MWLLSYAKLPMLSQVETVRNLSILYDIYGPVEFLGNATRNIVIFTKYDFSFTFIFFVSVKLY
jgi:hypothetical protein